jgi:hypothetical protein
MADGYLERLRRKKMATYKVGDRVRVRAWENMVRDADGYTKDTIRFKHNTFTRGMKRYERKEGFIVNVIHSELGVDFYRIKFTYEAQEANWSFTDEMTRPATQAIKTQKEKEMKVITIQDVVKHNEELVKALSIKHNNVMGGLSKEEVKALGSIVKHLFDLDKKPCPAFDIRYLALQKKFEEGNNDTDDLFDIFSMFRHSKKEDHDWVIEEAADAYHRYIEGLGKRRVTLFKSNNIKITFDCKKRKVRLIRDRVDRKYSVVIHREDLLHV